jgi:hypothetical protein
MAESSINAHDSAEFKPFVWNPLQGLDHKERRYALFLNDARDVVQGAHTLMELLAWDEDRRDEAHSSNGPAPLFSAADRASLQRFASRFALHVARRDRRPVRRGRQGALTQQGRLGRP